MKRDVHEPDSGIESILGKMKWDTGLNRRPMDLTGGSDRYSSFAEEFAGIIGFGPDETSAEQDAKSQLRRVLARATEDPARRAALSVRTVQLNVRMKEDRKQQIERRARDAGMTLGAYVERCCLAKRPGRRPSIARSRISANASAR